MTPIDMPEAIANLLKARQAEAEAQAKAKAKAKAKNHSECNITVTASASVVFDDNDGLKITISCDNERKVAGLRFEQEGIYDVDMDADSAEAFLHLMAHVLRHVKVDE
jgi:predicted  nucleic acid-binding Zn-ribbon protein